MLRIKSYHTLNPAVKISVILLIIFLANLLPAQVANYRIHPSQNVQIEPTIVRHPSNPLYMFASAYTISGSFRSEGIYFTTDGGSTWFGSDTCNTGSSSSNHGGDPGPVIDKDGRYILTHQGGFIVGMYSNYSTDFGSSWSNTYQIASGDQDKGTSGTDDEPLSPYYGRTYLVWTRFLNPFPVVSSYTSNGGVSWTASNQINAGVGGFLSLGADIKVDINGNVCVCWAGTLTSSPQNEKYCGFGISTNGGVTWTVNENIFNTNGVKTSSLQPWNIRINGYPHIDIDKSGGARNGWIYIVTGQKDLLPAGSDPDIILNRSTDGGITWSSSVRVNQDPLNNGKVQYFPAITVDDKGGINLLYYDNRNISSDSMDVFISRSTDGGDTWRDYRINQNRFRPKSVTGAGGAGNQGDNIGMVFSNNKLFPLWMDDHTGIYQIWYAAINLKEIGVTSISTEIPDQFILKQNYPNPFNPATKIVYDLPFTGNVNLKIYDALGKEVTSLVNEIQNPGTYSVEWNAAGFPSGIYFYRISAGDFTLERKMALVK
ncbi:MAG: T9SS type A sorting domain-containing protein [Bacteroidetes bacterium]|nr:T9SS type A sorting domain-containing protein [Bacteroidota bacterium]